MNNCLKDYLDKYNIIAKSQFGFKNGVSTKDAVADFTGSLVNKLDNK